MNKPDLKSKSLQSLSLFRAIASGLSSLKLTLWLMGALIAACMLGVFIPQGRPLAEYTARFGTSGFRLLHFFWLTEVFKSFWFKGLMLGLAAQLIVVMISSMRERKKNWGFIFVHLGLLVVIGGGFMSGFGRMMGTMKLEEGQTADSFQSRGEKKRLGFELCLLDFRMEHYPSQEKIRVETLNGKLREYPAAVGKRIEIPEFGYQLEIEKQAMSPAPSVYIRFQTLGKDFKLWIAEGNDGLQFPGGFFKVSYHRLPPAPKSYLSQVEILRPGRIPEQRVIQVNHPLHLEGFSIYQSSYDAQHFTWSEFEVVRDPGGGLVLAGGLLLAAGLFYNIYRPLFKKQPREFLESTRSREK